MQPQETPNNQEAIKNTREQLEHLGGQPTPEAVDSVSSESEVEVKPLSPELQAAIAAEIEKQNIGANTEAPKTQQPPEKIEAPNNVVQMPVAPPAKEAVAPQETDIKAEGAQLYEFSKNGAGPFEVQNEAIRLKEAA